MYFQGALFIFFFLLWQDFTKTTKANVVKSGDEVVHGQAKGHIKCWLRSGGLCLKLQERTLALAEMVVSDSWCSLNISLTYIYTKSNGFNVNPAQLNMVRLILSAGTYKSIHGPGIIYNLGGRDG